MQQAAKGDKKKNPLPTLFKIDRGYRVGSDTHYYFVYLAYPFVDGPSRTELYTKKISDMKGEFEKQHHGESIALMRMLLLECGDKKSSDLLAEFDSCYEVSFAGKNVTVENKEPMVEFYNFRRLLLHVVTKLDSSQVDEMVAYLQEEIGDKTSVPGSKLQSLLLLFDRAHQQQLIQPHNLDKLKEWLEVPERADLLQEVNQFEPGKQFPVSYHTSTEKLRSHSIEEEGPKEKSEFVSGNAKNNPGTAQ